MPTAVPSEVATASDADASGPAGASPLVDYHSNGHGNASTHAYTNGHADQQHGGGGGDDDEDGERIDAQADGEDGSIDEDDDWLMSDDEAYAEAVQSTSTGGGEQTDAGSRGDDMGGVERSGELVVGDPSASSPSLSLRARQQEMQMASRDSAKVQRTFYDTGYREGITSGKLSMLQQGFDEGFNLAAPVGRMRGVLRGQANAAHFYLSEYKFKRGGGPGAGAGAAKRRPGMGRGNEAGAGVGAGAATVAPHLDEAEKENVCSEARSILAELGALDVDVLLEPDWEAKQHEEEHRGGSSSGGEAVLCCESDEAKAAREGRLPEVRGRVEAVLGKVLR